MSNTALHKREKLNKLLKNWPSGRVMTQVWLEKEGFPDNSVLFMLEAVGLRRLVKERL